MTIITPWANDSTQIPQGLNSNDILDLAGLNWKVDKVPLFLGQDKVIQLPSHYALTKSSDNSIMGICGYEYIPSQNEEIMGFFDKFIKAGSMVLDSVGSLRGGTWVWALAKINDSFVLPGDDEVGAYLLLANPHIWGKAMTIKFTNIRISCMNTLTMALNDSFSKFRFIHTRDFNHDIMEYAEEALGLSKLRMKESEELFSFLASKQYSQAELIKFAMDLFGAKSSTGDAISLKRNGYEFLQYVEKSPGSDLKSAKGTWWGAFNALTYMCDYTLGEDEHRLFNSWFGAKERLKLEGLKLATKYAKK